MIDARSIRIIQWIDLPPWVKGGYSSEAQMRTLQEMTWAVDPDSDTYLAYDAEGRYAASFSRE